MAVEQWWDDHRRDNLLVGRGAGVLRFSNSEVRHEEPFVAEVLRHSFLTRGWRPAA